jgi:plastocyanin
MTTYTVSMIEHEYQPADLTIAKGDSVVWQNNGAMVHTATRTASPAFDTGRLDPGATSDPVTFDGAETGEIAYACRPHPFMKGRINITDKTTE